VGEGWNRLLTEIGRFMAVGGIATFAAFVIFNFLVHGLYLTGDPWLNGHPVTAFFIANFVGMLISYRLSRYWTFKHRPPRHADGGRTAYFVINMATMLIPMACLWMSRNVLGLDDAVSDNLAGVVIGQLLGQVARFYLFREYVFQKPLALDIPALVHWGDAQDVRFSSDRALDPSSPDLDATDPSTSGRAQPGAPGGGAG
jgi:putative flippase GtrA